MSLHIEDVDSWAKALFADIDSMDAEAFAKYFSEKGSFEFGSFPPAVGPDAIRDFVAYFFSTLKSLSHELTKINVVDGLCYVHFIVTYELKDGQTVAIPGLETIEMSGELIDKYIIYMDPSPLMSLQNPAAN